MNRLAVLIVEDEPEVRDALARDLEALADTLRIETADDVPDARAALSDIVLPRKTVSGSKSISRSPGTTGVDFLVELNDDADTRSTRKVLVTGQADQSDTIRAVNLAGLDHYIAKPWAPDDLTAVTIDAVTDYIISEGIDPLPYMRDLDAVRLLDAYSRRASDR